MNKIYTSLLLLLSSLSAYPQASDPVESALAQSGANRKSLENLLKHYEKKDKEKLEAVRFLIAHMPYKFQPYTIAKQPSHLHDLVLRADSTYYGLVKNLSDAQLDVEPFNTQVLSKTDQAYRKMMEARHFEEPVVEYGEYTDIRHVSADLLRRQVEHAFQLRSTSPFVKRLPFKDFLEYVLPYRALNASDARSADEYAQVYAKYLRTDTASSLRNVVWRYNLTARRLRYWGGTYPFRVPIGPDEMFFLGRHDCVQTADFGAMILRACGVPAAVDYNVAYKFWTGRHYFVSVPTERGWETFSPESELPKYRDPHFYECLNLMRVCFSRQEDNPYSLRNEGEPIPDILSDPCMADVTHEIGDTLSLSLPFTADVPHRLAYLASFHPLDQGLRPVTWGIIDHQKRTAHFSHVVPDHLYFPVYMDEEGDYHAFGEPFLVKETEMGRHKYTVETFHTNNSTPVRARLERKFPRKPSLVEAARKVPGTCVIASDAPDFAQADTLAVIREVPSTSWETIRFQPRRAYRYYRVCGAGTPPRVHLSELMFLTDRSYGYDNTMEIAPGQENDGQVRLLDEPLEKCKWKAEYDGNPQTAPDRWPHVTLNLKAPQMVHALRYMVKHADNAVKPGLKYELREWADGYWRKVMGNMLAQTDHLEVENLIPGQLYWLRALQGGREEMPFYVDKEGRQHFPQLEILERLNKIKSK